MVAISHDTKIGFLNFALGGLGLTSSGVFWQRYDADRGPFPQLLIHADTDPNNGKHVDIRVPIGLSHKKLCALLADPEKFGPTVPTILREFSQFLDPEEVAHGARTIRGITQLAFSFHEPMISRTIRHALQTLKRRSRVDLVKPILISSSGGGTGSALQILLAVKLMDPSFRRMITEGLPDGILGRPIGIVVDPYALAQLHDPNHHSRIMGNAKAFRIESEQLERMFGYQWVFHIGLANRFGTILSDPHELAWVAGNCLYELERNWGELMGRSTDRAAGALESRYTAHDIAEIVFKLRRGNGKPGGSP